MAGLLYNTRNVAIGAATGYYSRTPYAAIPADTVAVFDPAPWCGVKITFVAAPTAGNLLINVKMPRGFAVASVAFGSLSSAAVAGPAILAAVQALGVVRSVDVTVSVAANVVTLYVAGSVSVVVDPSGLTAPTAYTATPATWVNPGGTTEGFQVMSNKTSTPLYIEETPQQVAENLATQQYMIGCTLAEDRLDNLALLMNMQVTAVARVAGTVSQKSILTGLNTLPDFAFCLEMQNLAGLRRDIYIPQAKIITNNTWSRRRAAAFQSSAFQVKATCDAGDIQVIDHEVAA